jgi:hypothetical protein
VSQGKRRIHTRIVVGGVVLLVAFALWFLAMSGIR